MLCHRGALSAASGETCIVDTGAGELVQLSPKVREIIAEPESAGFMNRGGKGSHRNFVHPERKRPVTISGAPGDDAYKYQIRDARKAIEEVRR